MFHEPFGQDPSQSGLFHALRSDHHFLIFLLAYLMIAFVYFQNQSTFALQVHSLGLSSALYGTLISLNGLLIVFLELPISMITQRFPMGPVIAIGFLLTGLGFGLLAFVSTFPLLLLTVGIWTLGEMVESPVASAYVANLAPSHLRGRYQGTFGMTWGSGLILGPLLGTLLFAWSAKGLWLICTGLGLIAALLILIAERTKKRENAS
ncbi:MAG TPA: MFS transporter [Ktedonobacteraceae bacterium]|nr:MFS transporter [Ktedonobacteraceae bacterium]